MAEKKTTATKKEALKTSETPAAKTAVDVNKNNVDGSDQTQAQINAGLALNAKETEDGVKYYEGVKAIADTPAAKEEAAKAEKAAAKKPAAKKTAAKKAPAKKTAAKKTAAKKETPAADVDGSEQSQAQIDAGLALNAKETEDGVKYYEGVEAVAKEEAKKAPVKKAAAKKTAAKKAAANVDDSDQTKAQIDAGLVKNAEETEAGVKYEEGVAEVAKEEAKKAPAKKAPAKKTTKKAAANVDQSDQSTAQIDAGLKRNAEETEAGVKYAEGVAEVAKEEAAKAPAKKTAAKKAPAKKAAAKKTTTKKAAANVDQSDQSQAQIDAGLKRNAQETEAGVKYAEGVAALAKEAPEMISRQTLAQSAVRELNAQKALSAASKKAAAAAPKVTKPKPAPKKAMEKVIAKEEKAGAKIYKGIEEVPGTPYEETVKQAAAAAAARSRTTLASKIKPAIGKKKEAPVLTEEKKAFYDTFSLETLLEMAQALGFDLDMETLKTELATATNIQDRVNELITEKVDKTTTYTFEEDGFDETVIPVLCQKVADSLPYKMEDQANFAHKIEKDIDRILINEGIHDSAVYNDLFDDVRNILVFAQNNDLHTLAEVEQRIPADLGALVERFMTVARTMLPGWQYNDVKYYEGFLFGVLSQFEDLASLQNRAMMDVADLYILHGDYGKGDQMYNYVLRENQLKDQIYYRFANVYAPFDLQKAKAIANSALQFVDARYDYYPKIILILNR